MNHEMKRGHRLASARPALALVLALAWATAVGGCDGLLGIPGAEVAPDRDAGSVPDTASSLDDCSTIDGSARDAPAVDAPGMDAPGIDSHLDAPADDSGDACVSESNTCSSHCMVVTDNCGHTVLCGPCPSGQRCTAYMGSNTCCVLATCGNRCNVTISDNCGGTIACGICTSAGQVCNFNSTTCCTPDGTCGGPCLDNCGQNDPSCCDAG